MPLRYSFVTLTAACLLLGAACESARSPDWLQQTPAAEAPKPNDPQPCTPFKLLNGHC